MSKRVSRCRPITTRLYKSVIQVCSRLQIQQLKWEADLSALDLIDKLSPEAKGLSTSIVNAIVWCFNTDVFWAVRGCFCVAIKLHSLQIVYARKPKLESASPQSKLFFRPATKLRQDQNGCHVEATDLCTRCRTSYSRWIISCSHR